MNNMHTNKLELDKVLSAISNLSPERWTYLSSPQNDEHVLICGVIKDLPAKSSELSGCMLTGDEPGETGLIFNFDYSIDLLTGEKRLEKITVTASDVPVGAIGDKVFNPTREFQQVFEDVCEKIKQARDSNLSRVEDLQMPERPRSLS